MTFEQQKHELVDTITGVKTRAAAVVAEAEQALAKAGAIMQDTADIDLKKLYPGLPYWDGNVFHDMHSWFVTDGQANGDERDKDLIGDFKEIAADGAANNITAFFNLIELGGAKKNAALAFLQDTLKLSWCSDTTDGLGFVGPKGSQKFDPARITEHTAMSVANGSLCVRIDDAWNYLDANQVEPAKKFAWDKVITAIRAGSKTIPIIVSIGGRDDPARYSIEGPHTFEKQCYATSDAASSVKNMIEAKPIPGLIAAIETYNWGKMTTTDKLGDMIDQALLTTCRNFTIYVWTERGGIGKTNIAPLKNIRKMHIAFGVLRWRK